MDQQRGAARAGQSGRLGLAPALLWAACLCASPTIGSHSAGRQRCQAPCRAHLALRGGSSDSFVDANSKADGLGVLPDFMKDLVREVEEDEDEDGETIDSRVGADADYAKGGAAGRLVKTKKRWGEEEGYTMSLEDLGEVDLGTEEGLNRTHSVLQGWHEMMRERQKNPRSYLKDHPRWKFIQEVENFTAVAREGLRKFEEEVQTALDEMNESTFVQRLQARFPRNVTGGETWDEAELDEVLNEIEKSYAEQRERDDGPWWMLPKDCLEGAMTTACIQGDLVFVKELLQSGASPSEPPEEGNWPPLHWAVQFRHHEVFAELIQAGADPNYQTEDGMSPLQRACSENDASGARLLVSLGAHVRGKTLGGLTPMHYAAAYGGIDAAEVLCELGGDVFERDEEGCTPRERAEVNGEVDTVTWLREREQKKALD